MKSLSENFIYFIASTMQAVIFFLIGNWYNKKYSKKVQLLFNIDEWVPIITTNRDIQFFQLKDYVPSQERNVYYLKGTILNIGNLDIPEGNIYKKLSIHLPNDFLVSKIAFYTSNDDIKVIAEHKNNEVLIAWNLLKQNEQIKLELIIENNKKIAKDEIQKNIKINTRILNCKNIKVESLDPSNKENYKFSRLFILMLITFLLFLIGFLLYKNFRHNYKKDIKIELRNSNKVKINKLEYYNDSISTYQINQKEYFIKYRDIPKSFEIITTMEKRESPYIIISFFLFLIFLLIMPLLKTYKRLKILKLLESD